MLVLLRIAEDAEATAPADLGLDGLHAAPERELQ